MKGWRVLPVTGTESKPFHTKEVVSRRWQLKCGTSAHMVPHLSVWAARSSRCGGEQHFLEDTTNTWLCPSLLRREPEPQPNVRPWMSHFQLQGWWAGHKHHLWGWSPPQRRAEKSLCFHFTARLSLLIPLIQMLLFMLLREVNIADRNR